MWIGMGLEFMSMQIIMVGIIIQQIDLVIWHAVNFYVA